MKKNPLALAVAAGVASLSTGAYADMYVNADGVGEALIFPFYSGQGVLNADGSGARNETYVDITNSTAHYKAVKVRFREGKEGQETLDLNVYMGPNDIFSIGVYPIADGDGAQLLSADVTSIPTANGGVTCTVPRFDGTSASFQDALFSGAAREELGMIEVIEMGQIDPNGPVAAWIDADDCASMAAQWESDGLWTADPSTGFLPTWNGGGLYGTGTLVNVEKTTGAGFNAVAIDDLVKAGSSGSALHYAPGPGKGPTFSDSAVDGDLATLLTVKTIGNDFTTDAYLGALTDWIVTMPLGNSECQSVTITAYNRSGDSPNVVAPASTDLCNTVNVVHFGGASASSSETNLVNVSGYQVTGDEANRKDAYGSASMDFTSANASGLPVVGFAVSEYTYQQKPVYKGGVKIGSTPAKYQQIWDHRTLVTSS